MDPDPQLNLPLRPAVSSDGLTAADAARFRTLLGQLGWLTRRQLARLGGWNERQIRQLAESLGPEIVRGPKGFCTLDRAESDDVLRAADIAISQGKHMIRYGIDLKRRLHQRIG